MSLPCPVCDAVPTNVTDSRPTYKSIRRRRVCGTCGHRFTTYEVTTGLIAFVAEAHAYLKSLRAIGNSIIKEADAFLLAEEDYGLMIEKQLEGPARPFGKVAPLLPRKPRASAKSIVEKEPTK